MSYQLDLSESFERLKSDLRAEVLDEIRAELDTATRSPYLTVAEAAEYLRARKQRVYDLVSSGRLTRVKDGARVLIRRDELEAHLTSAAAKQVAPSLPHARPRRVNTRISS